MPSLKLTKRSIDALTPPADRAFLVYRDEDLPNFGLRHFKSGKKVFYVFYRRSGGGRRVSETPLAIGPHGVLTVDQARKRARDMLARVRLGEDPNAERAEQRAAITVEELFRKYLDELSPTKKGGTVDNYERFLRLFIAPALGTRKARDVKRADIARLHRKVGGTNPPNANRLLVFIRAGYNWGVRAGELPKGLENPANEIERFPERSRERYLTTEELARLGDALREAETIGLTWDADETKPTAKHLPKPENRREIISPFATAAIRLLLLTGCRLREILNLRWADVDLENGRLLLPDSKVGRRPVVLNAPSMAVLAALPRLGPVVLPGADPERPRSDLKKPWAAITRAAGLDGLRIHDLRHSFASVGAMSGLGLPMIGKLLGHSQPETTQRYAHLADSALKRASESIASTLAAAMGEAPTAEVIEIDARRRS